MSSSNSIEIAGLINIKDYFWFKQGVNGWFNHINYYELILLPSMNCSTIEVRGCFISQTALLVGGLELLDRRLSQA